MTSMDDNAQFRREWSKKQETDKPAQQQIIEDKIEKFQSSAKIEEGSHNILYNSHSDISFISITIHGNLQASNRHIEQA